MAETSHQIANGGCDQIEVQLCFRLATTSCTPEYQRNLSAGQAIPLSVSAANCVQILVHDQLLATGDIVRIGDRIGVRVNP
ncbi:MAG: FliM/FliN family flagellar motor switch protein [Planctomycetaceae bacterium]